MINLFLCGFQEEGEKKKGKGGERERRGVGGGGRYVSYNLVKEIFPIEWAPCALDPAYQMKEFI